MRRNFFTALSVGYLFSAIRSLLIVSRDDSIPLIVELLSARACPSGMLVLMRLAAAGSLAASGLAFSLARSPAHPAKGLMQGGLATHAALSLVGARGPRAFSKTLPLLAATAPPRAIHFVGLAAGLGDLATARVKGRSSQKPPLVVSPAVTVTAAATPRAFLLDIDGTLLMTDDIYYEAFKQLLAPLGIAVDPEWYSANVHGKTDAQVFERAMPGAAPEEVLDLSRRKNALFCELLKQRVSNSLPLVAGLAEALEVVKQLGVRCIAVTNAPRGAAEVCIETLRQHLPAASVLHPQIIVGAECTNPKPAPDPYLEGARVLGMAPRDCIVFEDSRSGVRAAVAAGVHAVVAFRTTLDDATLRAAGASLTLDDWNDLTPELIRQLSCAEPTPSAAARPTGEASPSHMMDLTRKVGSVLLPAIRLPPLGMLTAAVAMAALPGTCVQWGLHCNGEATEHTAGATRAAGAALLAIACAEHLWKTDNMNVHDCVKGADTVHLDAPTQQVLAAGVLASIAVYIHALVVDGHGLFRGARNVLMASALSGSTTSLLSAVLRRRPCRAQ